jgi:hypothetical protein
MFFNKFPLYLLILLIIFEIYGSEIVATGRKQMLKSDTTFDEEMERSSRSSIARNRSAEERINLSFPGTKWF